MSIVKSIELFFQEGSSDKVYNAQIIADGGAYTVKVQWGRRGSSLQEGTKAVKVALPAAEKKFASLVREKQGKGYEERTAAVQPAAVAPPDGQGSGSKSGNVNRRAVVGHKAQLLNPIEDSELDAYLANDKVVAQQKIDGMRILAHVTADGIVATNREGQTSKMDTRALAGLEYLPEGTVVDGELLDDGYWLFDVLEFAGEDIRQKGYLARWQLLDEEIEPALSGDIRIVPIAKGAAKKRALYDRLVAAGAEGIVFKDAKAAYTSGRPSSGGTQRKHKFIKSADVLILENAGNAYQMAVYDGKKLVECGRVFSGTTNTSRAALDTALGKKQRPICEVRYLYATDDHQLFQPVFVRIRDDKRAADCVRTQLLQTCRTVVT